MIAKLIIRTKQICIIPEKIESSFKSNGKKKTHKTINQTYHFMAKFFFPPVVVEAEGFLVTIFGCLLSIGSYVSRENLRRHKSNFVSTVTE